MHIDIRNDQRRHLFRAEVDLRQRPSVVKDRGGQEVYLQWDQAVDDEGYLRRCPICACRDLFVRKDFPQVTAFASVVLAAVVSLVLVGFRRILASVIVLITLICVDGAIFFFAPRCLVCYQCRSTFRRLPIRHRHPRWDPATEERHRPRGQATTSTGDTKDQAPTVK